MNSNPSETSAAASPSMSDQQVMDTLRRQQRRLKWLTGTAVALWCLAVVASVGVLVSYSVFYAPKERQIISDYQTYGHLRDRKPAGGGVEEAPNRPPTPEEKALGLHFTMSYVMTKAILIVALSVFILSCGTLATLLLVIFNRRVTLKQINHSLAQISEQLKALQGSRTGA
jgi:hypothetical protein